MQIMLIYDDFIGGEGKEGEGGEGGSLLFAGGRGMKIFSTVFRGFGKNMVGKRYLEH